MKLALVLNTCGVISEKIVDVDKLTDLKKIDVFPAIIVEYSDEMGNVYVYDEIVPDFVIELLYEHDGNQYSKILKDVTPDNLEFEVQKIIRGFLPGTCVLGHKTYIKSEMGDSYECHSSIY
jgi:hypothetical protein